MIKTHVSRVDGIEIKFMLERDRNYGMMLSGGIDSAILFYMILATYKERGWTPRIKPFTMRKVNERMETANLMVDHLNKILGFSIPHTTPISDPSIHHRDQGELAWKEIREKYQEIDFVYYASNAVPPWKYEGWEKDSRGLPKGMPARSTGEGGMVYLPFLNLYKYHTVDLVVEHGQEEIFRIARSCTISIDGPRCGQCFHCRERAWGFSTAGQEDPGIG